jgi:hypothetical protein
MAMMKMNTVSGTAMVFGRERDVHWSDNEALIGDVSHEEFLALIELLDRAHPKQEPSLTITTTTGVQPFPAATATATWVTAQSAAPTVPVHVYDAKAPLTPAADVTQQLENAAKPEKPAAKSAPLSDPSPLDDVPQELLNASTLRPLVGYLLDKGMSASDIVAECERLKERSPLLTKMVNLPRRVEHAVAVLNPPEPGSNG